jgi:hypothetical protein
VLSWNNVCNVYYDSKNMIVCFIPNLKIMFSLCSMLNCCLELNVIKFELSFIISWKIFVGLAYQGKKDIAVRFHYRV